MSSKQFLIDAASRRAIFVQLYSAGVERQFALEVAALMRDASSGVLVDGLRIGSSQSVMQAFLTDYGDLSAGALEAMESLSIDEAEFTTEMFAKGIDADIITPDDDLLRLGLLQARMNVAPNTVIDIQTSLSQYGIAKARQVGLIVNDGFTQGKTSAEVSNEIRQIVPIAKHHAASVIRTGMNTASSTARMQTIMANEDVLQGYEWVSTLDGRTSNICMARDGVVYPVSNSSPKPPAHWSCRSTIIPKVDPRYDLLSDVEGKRPSVGPNGAKQQSGNITYSGWLRKQPASFQDEVLGDTKGGLFRSGKLTLDKFVAPSGKSYTINELKGLYPLAFE